MNTQRCCRTDLVLTTYIPDGERDVLVLDGLHVESYDDDEVEVSRAAKEEYGKALTNRRNRGHHFSELQLVQDSRLTSSVQSDLETIENIPTSPKTDRTNVP